MTVYMQSLKDPVAVFQLSQHLLLAGAAAKFRLIPDVTERWLDEIKDVRHQADVQCVDLECPCVHPSRP